MAGSKAGLTDLHLADTERGALNLLQDSIQIQRDALVSPDEPLVRGYSAARIADLLIDLRDISRVPINPVGTPFQMKVWQALRTLPIGSTLSYQQLAEQIGMPKAVRAVASACGKNRLALVVPCHRIIRSDGGLGGFRWGLDRKQRILAFEASLLRLERKRVNR